MRNKTTAFENDAKADKYAMDNPVEYEYYLRRLAELQDCRERIKELRTWESEIISDISEIKPKPPFKAVIGGIGRVTISNSKNRKWDNEEMWNVMTARARDARLIDKETGEVLESEMGALRRVIEECAYISYWKVTPLVEKYGIDPDEYAEIRSQRPSVRIES
jgi:hypothetical protein|tara:strand:- start:62 stop:550 length:489 start_codon:yes stop_codon:yes gene_type:complete